MSLSSGTGRFSDDIYGKCPRFVTAQGYVSVQHHDLYRVAERRGPDHSYFHSLDDSKVHEPLPDCVVGMYLPHNTKLPGKQIVNRFTEYSVTRLLSS